MTPRDKVIPLTPQILRFDSLPSTNLEAAKRAADGAAEGLCVLAGEQIAGRGRLEREWVSPKGAGLYSSIIFRPGFDQSSWPLLTLMAAVAVHDALRECCGAQTDIKWPNDVLANDKKLCGILAETVDSLSGRAVIVGIGINLTNHAFPGKLDKVATSIEAVTGQAPDVEKVLNALLGSLQVYYEALRGPDGPERIIRAWTERSSYASGKRVRVTNAGETIEGISRGLECDGGLRLETADGKIQVIRAGDVTAVRAFK
ncbi:MAG TPA: biotin--[acetyl-CoA-carboxylase] ligase [Pyrinomonadaceae bacterium]|nr:biotin--[acetyl-CoA-carboxylase] ligase [Pyrinomonadaceae bacterium]